MKQNTPPSQPETEVEAEALSPNSNHPIRVAVFTGNRAEYGLLSPVIKALQHHPHFKVELFVGGDHLTSGSFKEIENDGVPIERTLTNAPALYDEQLKSDPSALMCLNSANFISQMHSIFSEGTPDWLLVLGDRFETFAVALAAFYHTIPIAHIAGGDITGGGCVDDTLRFSLSELASLHFVVSEPAKHTLLHRGEDDWRVILSGSPAIDNLLNTNLTPKEELYPSFNIPLTHHVALFTQHPVPADGTQTIIDMKTSLDTLNNYAQAQQAEGKTPLSIIATDPNQDGFSSDIASLIADSQQQHEHIQWHASLGKQAYLSWLASCSVVVGNSSSGFIETPFFKRATINIGHRQAGRLHGDNVIHCNNTPEAISSALDKALYNEAFITSLTMMSNPYGNEPCAPVICDALLSLSNREKNIRLKKRTVPSTQPKKADSPL